MAEPETLNIEYQVRKGLARSILGEKDWHDLLKRYTEAQVINGVLHGLDAVVSTKQARRLRRRNR